ncbi:MAG: NADH-quinone oxidoreductase subunit L, partial [bacterium]
PLLPLLGFLTNGLIGPRLQEKQVGILGSAVVGLSFLISASIFFSIIKLPAEDRAITETIYSWIRTGNFAVNISFLVDPLSVVMMLVVTGVGFLIHIYSVGYMAGDRGFARYFAFLNLFTFSMLLLVLADNFLLLFVGWEGVGLCSYLLIGFWFEDDYNAYAGRKAFVVNRVGDFGFLLGLLLIFYHFGTLNFNSVFGQVSSGLSTGMATAITLLLFVGATGKSAQIPLYVWLPDAMAGPTPVSALIHAATMVTAGVYMVARCHVLFLQSPTTLTIIAVVGAATAFLAATIALVNPDIKRVLAYSTISQLGYMFLACGVGVFWAGIFHLSTHAYFKALLFLSAGSVMHALNGETDMNKMGGLKDKLPVTYFVFVIGALALAGVPFLSGFFSKDEILWKAVGVGSEYGGFGFWLVGAFVAGLTAFYIFRLIYLTFYGKSRVPREVAPHIHESPKIMTIPLGILAFLSIVGGFIGIPHMFNKFEHFLQPVFSRYATNNLAHTTPAPLDLELSFMAISIVIAFLGIGFAYLFYVKRPNIPIDLASKVKGLYTFLYRKWYMDEIYDALIVRPIKITSDIILWRWFDVKIIDGLVNGVAVLMKRWSDRLRRTETGVVQNYALSIVIGVVLLIGYFLLK